MLGGGIILPTFTKPQKIVLTAPFLQEVQRKYLNTGTMKNRKNLYMTFLFFAAFASAAFCAQPADSLIFTERIDLITDRAVYSSGEIINFLARETGLMEGEFHLSEVLYIDIITPEGQIIQSSKFPMKNGYSSGNFRIPEDVLTGTYYLRSYTRWIRNYSDLDMSYLSLWVINPRNLSQLPLNATVKEEYKFKQSGQGNGSLPVQVTTNEAAYGLREEVMLKLKNEDQDRRSLRLSISVVPAGARGRQVRNHSHSGKGFPDSLLFLPETRGISISGKVRNQEDNKFEAFSPVFLTLLDAERTFLPGISDSTGSFHFALPDHYGMKDLFISVRATKEKSLEVLIDRDFALLQSDLTSPGIDLDSLEYRAALDIVRNEQLRTQYYPLESKPEPEKVDSFFFYGIPAQSLKVNFYIDLPSLEEYFLELIPVVSISRAKGEPRFLINSQQAEMRIYDPLIMIDGVVIHDNEAVLKIDPRNIDRIDIVDRPWIRGDLIFGGIISIRSRNNDFAGVDLPESGLFLSYRFFEPHRSLPQSNVPEAEHLPDVRNTLYWQPDLILEPGKESLIRFKTGDRKGEYTILVREITREGQIREIAHPFTVE
jgi:hypothetical protein